MSNDKNEKYQDDNIELNRNTNNTDYDVSSDSHERKEIFEGQSDNHVSESNLSISDKDKNNKEGNKKNKVKSIITDVVLYAIIVYACLYLIPTYIVQRTIVDGPSMENSLHNGEHLLVEKISYHFDALDRFDVVVFYPYGREVGEYYVKRIIGLPGETVQIIGEDIYING